MQKCGRVIENSGSFKVSSERTGVIGGVSWQSYFLPGRKELKTINYFIF
jgi:hypothetical protein